MRKSSVKTGSGHEVVRLPNRANIEVGKRIRFRRCAVGMSSEKLAAAIGATDEQVRALEAGTESVGAVQLQRIIVTLGVTSAYFLANARPDEMLAEENRVLSQVGNGVTPRPEVNDLVRGFSNIRYPVFRNLVVRLVVALSEV